MAQPLAVAMLLTTLASRPLFGQTPSDHQFRTEDILEGSRLYTNQCALCHSANGDGVDGIDLRLGRFRRPMSDEELRRSIEVGNPDAGMPAFPLRPAELDQLIAFIRAGFDPSGEAVSLGDAERGRALFEGKGACASCHRVRGSGPRTGPELSDIGAIRTPARLQRKLLDPTAALLPIHRPVRIVTRNGRTIRGRRLNEDTYSVQLIDSEERLVSLLKEDVAEYERSQTSAMPKPPLTPEEIADVIAYLLTLRGL